MQFPSILLHTDGSLEEFSSTYTPQISAVLTEHFSLAPETTFEPIVITAEKTTITVGQVRDLIREMSYTTVSNLTRLVLIWKADTLHPVAQQALLKILEEPPANTIICLITAKPDMLLPTILSRCVSIPLGISNTSAENSDSADEISQTQENLPELLTQQLLKQTLTYSELFTQLAPYKDKSQAQQLLLTILTEVEKHDPSAKNTHVLHELQQTSRYLQSNANPVHQLEALIIRCSS